MLNKFKENETYFFGKKSDMEMNLLRYPEAIKKGTRSFLNFIVH